MMLDAYTLAGGLAKEQIDLMRDKAIDLVETVGLQIPHEGLLNRLQGINGVTIDKATQMVKFRSDLVTKAIKEMKFPLPEYYEDGWVISAGAHQTKIVDLESGKIRETTHRDLVEMIKIGDALDTVGSAPVVPMDVPIQLQEIMMHKVAWEHSRRRANDMFEHDPKPTVRCAEYVYEMSKVADKWFALGLYMVSPRSFDVVELEIIDKFLDKGVPMWAGTMPIMGVNSPITEKAGIQQAMFETYGCLTMLNLLNTKGYNYIQIIDSFIAHPFDMKYSTFVYGSAEDVRATADKLSIHKHLKMPLAAKSLLTAAKEPDAQAAAEVGMYTLMAALAGAKEFRCAGLLTSAEVYSAEKLVLDYEIVQYIKNVLKPEEFSDDMLLFDAIAKIKPGESFLEHPSTFKHYRTLYWDPNVFLQSNLGQWQEMGSKSFVQIANERAKRLLKEHEYQIDPEKKRELDRIYEIAAKDEELAKERQY